MRLLSLRSDDSCTTQGSLSIGVKNSVSFLLATHATTLLTLTLRETELPTHWTCQPSPDAHNGPFVTYHGLTIDSLHE
jgi:hypothetical protein